MLTVRETRALATQLSWKAFRAQMGPFALVQSPPPAPLAHQALLLQAGRTHVVKERRPQKALEEALASRDELLVATLPPLSDVDMLTVGRLPDCELVVDDPSVSKRHARLRWNASQHCCTVQDAGSTNGTEVNHRAIGGSEVLLEDGATVQFGDAQFWFVLAETLYGLVHRPNLTPSPAGKS